MLLISIVIRASLAADPDLGDHLSHTRVDLLSDASSRLVLDLNTGRPPADRLLGQLKLSYTPFTERQRLDLGLSARSQSLSYEFSVPRIGGDRWTGSAVTLVPTLHTSLLAPNGASFSAAVYVGPVRLGLGYSLYNDLTWKTVRDSDWTLLSDGAWIGLPHAMVGFRVPPKPAPAAKSPEHSALLKTHERLEHQHETLEKKNNDLQGWYDEAHTEKTEALNELKVTAQRLEKVQAECERLREKLREKPEPSPGGDVWIVDEERARLEQQLQRLEQELAFLRSGAGFWIAVVPPASTSSGDMFISYLISSLAPNVKTNWARSPESACLDAMAGRSRAERAVYFMDSGDGSFLIELYDFSRGCAQAPARTRSFTPSDLNAIGAYVTSTLN